MTKQVRNPNRWLLLLASLGFLMSSRPSAAIDPRLHQIDVQTWGPVTNGMEVGFGIDKRELENLGFSYVTVEFVIKNHSNSRRVVAELGGYNGITFVRKSVDGNEQELFYEPHHGAGSVFIHGITPGEDLHLYRRIRRNDLLKVAAVSGEAQVLVREGEQNPAVPISPFKIEVPIILPH